MVLESLLESRLLNKSKNSYCSVIFLDNKCVQLEGMERKQHLVKSASCSCSYVTLQEPSSIARSPFGGICNVGDLATSLIASNTDVEL